MPPPERKPKVEETATPPASLKRDAVYEWRKAEFVRLGFAVVSADLLAAEIRVDLHAAERLTTGGCPPELALQILF